MTCTKVKFCSVKVKVYSYCDVMIVFSFPDALHYDAKEMAAVASLPFLAMALSAAFGGIFIDKTLLRFLNTTYVRQ